MVRVTPFETIILDSQIHYFAPISRESCSSFDATQNFRLFCVASKLELQTEYLVQRTILFHVLRVGSTY